MYRVFGVSAINTCTVSSGKVSIYQVPPCWATDLTISMLLEQQLLLPVIPAVCLVLMIQIQRL